MKTDSHIRTQCFSLTRKDDGSVKIWNRDEEEITLIKAEAAKEAAFFRAMELEVSKNNSLLAELQAEIKHDEDSIGRRSNRIEQQHNFNWRGR